MTKLLIKLLIALLEWLVKPSKKDSTKARLFFDFNGDDKNDIEEWIEYLKAKLEK